MHALDAHSDVMNLMLSTPVPTGRTRPQWVDASAHWTEVGEIESSYVPRSQRPRSNWMPIVLAASAAMTTMAASAATVTAVLVVAFVL